MAITVNVPTINLLTINLDSKLARWRRNCERRSASSLRRLYTRFTAAAMRDDPSSSEFVVLDTLADADVDSQRELAERLGPE